MSRVQLWSVLVLATGLAVPNPLHGQDAVADVRGVIEAYASYSQARNLTAIDTLWAPGRGVHIIEGAGVNHGWADYRDNHLKPELDQFEEFRLRYRNVEPVVRGNVAWASFQYDLHIKMASREVERVGRGTAILEKRDGRWVMVHLHTSGRAPRPQN